MPEQKPDADQSALSEVACRRPGEHDRDCKCLTGPEKINGWVYDDLGNAIDAEIRNMHQ